MDYDTLDLENLALDIRKLFLGYKKNKLRKPHYKPHPDHDAPEVWFKAAVKCSELGSDALSFVEAAFRHCKQAGPFPKQLHSKAMNRWCEGFVLPGGNEKSELTAYEDSIKTEINTVANICYAAFVNRGIPIEESLVSNFVHASACVKIFLMPDSTKVLDKFKEKALEELRDNPGLHGALENLGMDLTLIFE